MIRPLRDMLVLVPLTKPGKIGLIIIPDSGKQRDKTGGYCKVVSAGPTCVLAKVGDTVHVTAYGDHYAGDPFEHDGQKVVLIRERDINGVVETTESYTIEMPKLTKKQRQHAMEHSPVPVLPYRDYGSPRQG